MSRPLGPTKRRRKRSNGEDRRRPFRLIPARQASPGGSFRSLGLHLMFTTSKLAHYWPLLMARDLSICDFSRALPVVPSRRMREMWLLSRLFNAVVKQGHLRVVGPDGRAYDFGEVSATPIVMKVDSNAVARRVALNPDMAFGEAYTNGQLTVEAPHQIEDLMSLLLGNVGTGAGSPLMRVANAYRHFRRSARQYNPISRARRNVAHHYDLDGRFYALFLDPDQQYSCAFFEHPDASLEDAQAAKKRRIAAKLHLAPGLHVLDIGSGWGGLGLMLAREFGASVTGVTLSVEQHKISTARAAELTSEGRARFELMDYRAVQERFDRIVSVGMFEHVGVRHYAEFFGHVARLLTDNGVALIHTIGRLDGPGATNPWIDKYIFPGGYTPALSEMVPIIEKAGLMITDVEVLRLHYAETLRHWRARFRANWDKAAALTSQEFCRMWEFYLTGAEMGFRHQGLAVFQVQMAKRVDALPLSRDYMQPRANQSEDLTHRPAARTSLGA